MDSLVSKETLEAREREESLEFLDPEEKMVQRGLKVA